MSPRARIILAALLIAGAVIVVRAPLGEPDAPGSSSPRAGDPDAALTWAMLFAVPGVALLIVAVLRYTPTRRPPQSRRELTPPNWRKALLALAAVVLITVGLALLGRLVMPQRKPSAGRRPGGAGVDPPQPGQRRPSTEAPDGGGEFSVELWSAVLAAMLLALFAAGLIARRRQARQAAAAAPEPDDAELPAREPPLAVAVRRALSTVDEPGVDPRAAIIRCYAAMERALAEAPDTAPQPADTPSEVLRRATEAGELRGADGPRLVHLFAEARYSTHPITEADRATAADTLRAILHQLRGAEWTRS